MKFCRQPIPASSSRLPRFLEADAEARSQAQKRIGEQETTPPGNIFRLVSRI